MVGKPVIRGTRIPAEVIVRIFAAGMSENEILKDYPQLTQTDIRAALAYAAAALSSDDILPLTGTM